MTVAPVASVSSSDPVSSETPGVEEEKISAIEVAAVQGSHAQDAERTVADVATADAPNEDTGPLLQALMLHTEADWRAVLGEAWKVLAEHPGGRHLLAAVFAFGQLNHRRGYNAGHADAQRGRYFSLAIADDQKKPTEEN